MIETTMRLFNNLAIPLQSAVIDAHLPAGIIDPDLLIQSEAALISIFTRVNPQIVITKEDTGRLFCRVGEDFVFAVKTEIRNYINSEI